ncbi:hypothetical protein LG293_17185 (plasmid) [Citricoccus nitrophenolicus]
MSTTTEPATPSVEELAEAYPEARAEASAQLTRVAMLVGNIVLASIFVITAWTALDPQPDPIVDWLQASDTHAISGAFLAFVVTLSGLIKLGIDISRRTLRRAFDGARPTWVRLVAAALFIAALSSDLAPDPFFYVGGLVIVLMAFSWVEDRLHQDRLLTTAPTDPEGAPDE